MSQAARGRAPRGSGRAGKGAASQPHGHLVCLQALRTYARSRARSKFHPLLQCPDPLAVGLLMHPTFPPPTRHVDVVQRARRHQARVPR